MSVAVRLTDAVAPASLDWPGPVSFDVDEGAFCVVRTTISLSTQLTRLLVGLREPTGGTVEVLGVEPGKLNRWQAQRFRRRLGVGFSEPAGLVSNLTLRMNLIVPLLYSGSAEMSGASERADRALAECGLSAWADLRPADLPPDVAREAVIARAIVRDPDLLLLEDPVGPLRESRAGFLLGLCRRRARTAILTTMERESVLYDFADTILLLDERGLEISHNEVGAD